MRTTLRFYPQATLAQQATAIEKAVKVVEDEIVRTAIDQTFRVNELWFLVRSAACQEVVVDVGEPNHPFQEILVWRDGKPEALVGDYVLKRAERLIVEPTMPAAIDIRPAGGRAF
jgi:hypothetical protein